MTPFDDLQNPKFFPEAVPTRPGGHYAHIVTLRVTESYPIFRTDGGLNVARVPVGRSDPTLVDRITMFMRKQTTPERLRGRELLRQYNAPLVDECRYNESPCGTCPDCVAYGYAIGDTGAEKAKVFGDSAYSLSAHTVSHEVNTFNAPNEGGIMYDPADNKTSNRINSTEYVKPGVIFPTVTTTRDLTFTMFCYVLNNLISTKRYGATSTRTGRVDNQVIAIIVADGEIMSNLALTQALYDMLQTRKAWPDDDLVSVGVALDAAQEVLPALIRQADVHVRAQLVGSELTTFLDEFRVQVSQQPEQMIGQVVKDAAEYRTRLTAKPDKKAKRGK